MVPFSGEISPLEAPIGLVSIALGACMIRTDWALQLICIRPCRGLIIPFSNIIKLLSIQLQHHTHVSGNVIDIAFETESADAPCTPVRMY